MKKRAIITGFMTAMLALASGCGAKTDDAVTVREDETRTGCVEGCVCTGCICCGTALAENGTAPGTVPVETVQTEENTAAGQENAAGEETQESEPVQPVSETKDVSGLSEGERAARREQQVNFAAARETVYILANSKDKTEKINQMDRQILANNAYDFSGKNIVFIGDSITEGVEGAVDADGNRISYVNYADAHLHFNRTLNHGMGGRMFAAYADETLSLALNFGNVTNIDSDIIVVFAGVNDYLSTPENKRFGNVDDKVSTAGYCGSVRYFMKQLKEYYGDREVFFVTMYNIPRTAVSTYADAEGPLGLNDYLEVQRRLAAEYGFHIIELYDIGFMDCADPESGGYYLKDGLHPNDNGNIVLGDHIAAELSLYFGQKEGN